MTTMPAPASEAPLLEARAEFPILANSVYFAAHTLGPVSLASLEALKQFGEAWATRGVRAWGEGWWMLPELVGNAIGALMNAPAGSVITTSHATESLAAVLASLSFGGERDGLVTTSLEFPSLLYQARAWERHGARLTVTPARANDPLTPDLDALLAAITPNTRLVSVCHVYFRNAAILDVRRVVERAHEVGALVCLDCYQSLGTTPLDVTALGVDFALGGSVKWVLGGPGVGYLYVRPGLADDLPGLRGWSGHADPFGFEEEWRPARGARRFATGTPNVPALAACLPGYELIARLGVPAIRAKSLRQTQTLMDLARAAGFRVVNPTELAERGGSVVLDLTPAPGHAVSTALNARGFVLDYRVGAGLRLAPHFYTTDDELRSVIGATRAVIDEGAFTPYLQRGAVT